MDKKISSNLNGKSSIFFTDTESPASYSLSNQFAENLEFRLVRDRITATGEDAYFALSLAIRDRLVRKWLRTQHEYNVSDVKRVYYLSMEYMMGRLLGNALINMDFYDECYEILKEDGYSLEEINTMLTKESGLLGITEKTSDCRFVEDNYETDAAAKRAMDLYCYRLAKYIASYTASLDGRLDAVVFTGGIGENSAPIRQLTLARLSLLGFKVNEQANLANRFGKESNQGIITEQGSTIAMVIATNEELIIARDTLELVSA